MFPQLLLLLVSYLIQSALAPKQKPPTSYGLSDFDVPTAEEGREIPVIFGEVIVKSPNCVWYGGLRKTAIKSKGGKK